MGDPGAGQPGDGGAHAAPGGVLQPRPRRGSRLPCPSSPAPNRRFRLKAHVGLRTRPTCGQVAGAQQTGARTPGPARSLSLWTLGERGTATWPCTAGHKYTLTRRVDEKPRIQALPGLGHVLAKGPGSLQHWRPRLCPATRHRAPVPSSLPPHPAWAPSKGPERPCSPPDCCPPGAWPSTRSQGLCRSGSNPVATAKSRLSGLGPASHELT